MCVIVLQLKCLVAVSKWRKSENLDNAFYVFLRFFDMTLQKNVKNVFSNYVWKYPTPSIVSVTLLPRSKFIPALGAAYKEITVQCAAV